MDLEKGRRFCLPGKSPFHIEGGVLINCLYDLEMVAIPEGVAEIGTAAFRSSRLKEVSLPQSLKKLGCSCFQDTRLAAVHIPGSVGVIPENAFRGNHFLETVWLGEGITHIAKGAFRDCTSLHELNCPSTLVSVDQDAFANSPVMTVSAPPCWLLGRQDLVDKILWKFK